MLRHDQLNRIIRQLEIRMVENLRGLIAKSVNKWSNSVKNTTSAMVYTELHIPSHYEAIDFINQEKEQQLLEHQQQKQDAKTSGKDDDDVEQEPEPVSLPTILPIFRPTLEELTDAMCDVMNNISSAALSFDSLVCPDLLAMLSIDTATPIIQDSVAKEAVHSVIQNGQAELFEIVEKQLKEPKFLIEQFSKFTSVMSIDPTTYWSEWEANENKTIKDEETGKTMPLKRTLDASKNEITRLIKIAKDVEQITDSSSVTYGPFEIRVRQAKDTLIQHAMLCATSLVRGLVDNATEDSRKLEIEYANIFERVSVTPSSESELVEQRTFLRSLDMVLLKMYRRSKAACKSVEVRSLVSLNLEKEEFFSLYNPKLWPNRIIDAKDLQATILEQQKTAMIEVLERDVRKFENHLDKLSEEADAIKLLSDVEQLKHIVERSDSLIGALEQAREKSLELNRRLDAFGWDPNLFVTLDATETTFAPFGQLWTDFAEFRSSKNEWLNESFLQLNGVEVRDQVEKTWVNSYKQAKRFANDFPEVSKGRYYVLCFFLPALFLFLFCFCSDIFSSRFFFFRTHNSGQNITRRDYFI